MSLVVGCDPGNSGAFAKYDSDTGELDIIDMPKWFQAVGNKKRPRVDGVAILEMAEMWKLEGIDLFVMEAVGGRPRESASAAFVFGYGVGIIYQSVIAAKLMLETVPPQTWKKVMRCPKDEEGIAQRFQEIFPNHRGLIRGAKGAIKHDRAEAALLAKFGADRIHPTMISTDAEWKLAYRKATTGA
jgi:hypothetical protein